MLFWDPMYLETPTTERTDRESSEECPRHRTFRPKLLTFSGGGPHPFDQAGVPVGYYPTFTHHLNIAHYMVIDYRHAATFTHRHHIMQTERYIFFVAVAFTLKITLTDRAHICLIKRSFAFYVLCECARHHFNIQNAHFHFFEGTWSKLVEGLPWGRKLERTRSDARRASSLEEIKILFNAICESSKNNRWMNFTMKRGSWTGDNSCIYVAFTVWVMDEDGA